MAPDAAGAAEGIAGAMQQLVSGAGLATCYQPIAALGRRELFGYEALTRGPAGTPFEQPSAMFAMARELGLDVALEITCARLAIARFAALGLPGYVAINFSGQCIERLGHRAGRALGFLTEYGIAPGRIVIELTEHDRIVDPPEFKHRLHELRALGIMLALDDFGDGHSSLRLWAELAPQFVKIDKYFVHGLASDPARFQCVKALVNLGEVFGTRLVAEGIESEAELLIIRDLGIELGQGFFVGPPEESPPTRAPERVTAALGSQQIAVYPETVKMPMHHNSVGKLVLRAPTLRRQDTNNRAVEIFAAHPDLHAVAILEDDRPIGILNRHRFMDRYAQQYYRELYGKRSCTAFMNDKPLCFERSAPIDALTAALTDSDQRYLVDGLVVTEGGRYLGLASGESVVRAVAEIRVEAARYANPLTFLPGNIPVSEHIARLLASGVSFTACYTDLNQFKPYNDQYGYWKGDQMIKLAARCISQACDPLRDFLGHVGGDDFIVLFQAPDWAARCRDIIETFNVSAPNLFNAADRERGGIMAEDRQGRPAFFALTTLSIGAVRVHPGRYRSHEDVASAAAAAKREAKHRGAGLFELQESAAVPMAEERPTV